MARDRPAGWLLCEAGLVILSGQIHLRGDRAWLTGWRGTYGMLRQHRPSRGIPATQLATDATWLHAYAGIIPVLPEDARLIPPYMRGRGLQMIARRVRAGLRRNIRCYGSP